VPIVFPIDDIRDNLSVISYGRPKTTPVDRYECGTRMVHRHAAIESGPRKRRSAAAAPDEMTRAHGRLRIATALDSPRAGQAERAGVLTCGVAALVADQVDLNEPRHRVVPVRPGPDRDLAFQQRPRLGVAAALELARAPFRRQTAVDGGADMPTSSVAVCSSMSSSPTGAAPTPARPAAAPAA
jgi:hypothetical protein